MEDTTLSQAEDQAADQAALQYESICELVALLDDDNTQVQEKATEDIQEDPLEVCVRSDWHSAGDSDNQPTEYYILLCTGGPAVRIIGTLDNHGEPDTATLEYQDWGTPWTRWYPKTGKYDDDYQANLMRYAACFYYAI